MADLRRCRDFISLSSNQLGATRKLALLLLHSGAAVTARQLAPFTIKTHCPNIQIQLS